MHAQPGEAFLTRLCLRLEAQKAEVVAQANAQKALLAKEVKHLRSELDISQQRSISTAPAPAATTEDQVRAISACVCASVHVLLCVRESEL